MYTSLPGPQLTHQPAKIKGGALVTSGNRDAALSSSMMNFPDNTSPSPAIVSKDILEIKSCLWQYAISRNKLRGILPRADIHQITAVSRIGT